MHTYIHTYIQKPPGLLSTDTRHFLDTYLVLEISTMNFVTLIPILRDPQFDANLDAGYAVA